MRTDDTPATASTGPAAGATALLRVLVEYRLVVYLGGLAAIAAPTLLAYADVTVALSTRRLVVGIALGTMVLTYLGERRYVHGDHGTGSGHDDGSRGTRDANHGDGVTRERSDGPDAESFDWRTRLALVGAIAGIALGVYVAVAVDLLYGVVFVAGAYLFAQLAVQSRGEGRG